MSMRQYTRGIALALALAASLSGRGQTPPLAPGTRIVDLTHTLDERFPFIPVPGVTFPFKATPIATFEKNGVAANRWDIHEHIGTQIDAPNHFAREGVGLEALPVRTLIVPLAVIDISDRARRDADAAVTVEDIAAWEKAHGRLPDDSAVFMYSGWESRLEDPKAFINADAGGTMHFPGFSREAAGFLLENRRISGIGVDTISIDPGPDKEYRTHKLWLGAGRWAVEAVANLREVPAAGATVFVGAPKVRGATGGPVRLLAMVPENAAGAASTRAPMQGFWTDDGCQVQERDGRRTSSRSVFAIFEREWGIAFTQFADDACRVRAMTASLRGAYEPTGESREVPGAIEVTFRFSQKALVAYDPALVERLNAGACGDRRWVSGQEQDITSAGCLSIASFSSCPQEYDLAKIDGDALYLGERPAPGSHICTEDRRPRRLRREPLRRP